MGKINVSPNHKIKTVFVIDKSLFRKQSSVTSKVPIWNFAIDASLEYCRIVWDISPHELIRFIINDNSLFHEEIGKWRKEDPNHNLAYIKSSFAERITFDEKCSMDSNVSKGIKVALETLSLCSDDQLEEMKSVADKGSKVSNKGRVICLTSILEDDSIEILESFAKKTITTINEGNLKSNQMQIDNCDLLIINIFPDPTTSSALKEHPYFEISPFLSCELISVGANHQLVNCLKRLVLKHFDLASTTIEGISFPSDVTKTPETPNRIEIFHPVAAHDCFAKPEFESPPFSFKMDKGYGYKTVVMSGYPTANLSSSSLIKLSSISPNCWRISPFINDKIYQDLAAFILNSMSGRPLLFKILLENDTKLTNLFMLAADKGEVRLQQINWLDLEDSSIPVPLIQPREKVCPEKNKTSAPHVDKTFLNQTVPTPLDSSNAGLEKNSQMIQETKLNADSSKPKNISKVNKIEQASKKRKTDEVFLSQAKLVKQVEYQEGTNFKDNPISTVSIGLDDPIPFVMPERIDQKTETPIPAESAVTMDQDAKKMRPSQDNSSSVKPVPKKVRSSLPTENAGRILRPKDGPLVNDSNDQEAHNKVKEVVPMDDEQMVQESQVITNLRPKKSGSSQTLSVDEICHEFHMTDVQVDLETEDLIIKQGIEYKLYIDLVSPLVKESNPNVPQRTRVRLVAAKWRELKARHQSRESHLGEKLPLPRVAKKGVTNVERVGFKKQISHLNQQVTNLTSIVDSLVAKSNTTGSLKSTSSSDITGGASSGSGTSFTETLKEQPNSAQGPSSADDDLQIKLEIDDEVQLLYEVPSTRPNSAKL